MLSDLWLLKLYPCSLSQNINMSYIESYSLLPKWDHLILNVPEDNNCTISCSFSASSSHYHYNVIPQSIIDKPNKYSVSISFVYKESLIYKLRLQALSIYIIQENKTLMILQKLLIIIWENIFVNEKKKQNQKQTHSVSSSHIWINWWSIIKSYQLKIWSIVDHQSKILNINHDKREINNINFT